MSVDIMDTFPTGPSGTPYAYRPDGMPATVREAARLVRDIEARTLKRISIRLADGQLVIVRVMGLVYDHDAATGPVPADYRPLVWGTALFTPPPENNILVVLAEYRSPEAALAEFDAAMTQIALAEDSAVDHRGRPTALGGLPWAGPQ